jgi:molybdopterin-guanine dinucleotide biosynthesis protein B
MRIFGIAGFKNAGKTTLIVDIVRELTGRGFKVATVKHAHHEFDIDHPGKDSYQHREAGAQEVIVSSARRWAHIKELVEEPEPQLEELLQHLGDMDLVLVEGYKYGDHPKLEIRRADQDAPFLTDSQSEIRAIVCDGPITDAPVPVLPRENIKQIADFIIEHATRNYCRKLVG